MLNQLIEFGVDVTTSTPDEEPQALRRVVVPAPPDAIARAVNNEYLKFESKIQKITFHPV